MFHGIPLDSFQAQFFGRLLSSGVRRDQLPQYVKLAEDRFGPVAGQWLREGLTKLAQLQPPPTGAPPAAPAAPAWWGPLTDSVAGKLKSWRTSAQDGVSDLFGFPRRAEMAEMRQLAGQAKDLMANPLQGILGKDGGKFFAENKSWLIPLLLGGAGVGLGGVAGGGTGAALGGIGLPLIYMLMNNPEMRSKFTGMFGAAKTETPPVVPPAANPAVTPLPLKGETPRAGGKPVAVNPMTGPSLAGQPPSLTSQTAATQLPASLSPTSLAGQPPAITPSTDNLPPSPNLMPPPPGIKFAEVPVTPAVTVPKGNSLAGIKANAARMRAEMQPAIEDDQRQRAALRAAGKPVPNTLTHQRVGGQLLQPGQPTPQQQQIQGLSSQLNDGLPPNIMPPAFPQVKPVSLKPASLQPVSLKPASLKPMSSTAIPYKSKTFDP